MGDGGEGWPVQRGTPPTRRLDRLSKQCRTDLGAGVAGSWLALPTLPRRLSARELWGREGRLRLSAAARSWGEGPVDTQCACLRAVGTGGGTAMIRQGL